MKEFVLGEHELTWKILVELALAPNPKVVVSKAGWEKLDKFRKVVDDVISRGETVYGINTGFGFLADVRIESSKLKALQVNLIKSHACGVGDLAEDALVRALLILRAHTFLLGHSAVRPIVVKTILAFLEKDILPEVPVQGSVGASGDLAPLAHLAMGLIGDGRVKYKGSYVKAAAALKEAGIEPLTPDAKEGLALINGTQFMAAVGSFALAEAESVLKTSDIAAALSLDAIRGTVRAFDQRIQSVRKQPGQEIVAQNIRDFFADKSDQIMKSHENCSKVQDPYSFRCVPQVHGASRDVFSFCEERVNGDLNSVTDNPLVFLDGQIISGGNFHGQPLAIAMDMLAIAIAEIGSISERRIEKITNPAMSGLPAFAVKEGGLNSGFMIPHVVAAALVSENKILCHPASVDSIPTSADKEDHVSMGPIAARKARKVIKHVRDVLAIEFLTAAQGIDLLSPLRPGKILNEVYTQIRKISKVMDEDRSLYDDISEVSKWISSLGAVKAVEKNLQSFK